MTANNEGGARLDAAMEAIALARIPYTVRLEPEHRRRARALGRQFGEAAEDIWIADTEMTKIATADDNLAEAIDAIAVDHGERLFGMRDGFPEREMEYLKRYLHELSSQVGVAIVQTVLARRTDETESRAEEAERQERERERGERERAKRRPPAPQALPFGASAQGAEALVAKWMQHLGIASARTTRYSRDGGVDVESHAYVAQVKHQQGTVGAGAVREVFGVATMRKKVALFFTTASYSPDALDFAARAGVVLFIYSPERGSLTASNAAARRILDGDVSD